MLKLGFIILPVTGETPPVDPSFLSWDNTAASGCDTRYTREMPVGLAKKLRPPEGVCSLALLAPPVDNLLMGLCKLTLLVKKMGQRQLVCSLSTPSRCILVFSLK